MDADDVAPPERLRAPGGAPRRGPGARRAGHPRALLRGGARRQRGHARVRASGSTRSSTTRRSLRDLLVESPLAHPRVMMRAAALRAPRRLPRLRRAGGLRPLAARARRRARGSRSCPRCSSSGATRRRGSRAPTPRYAPARFRDAEDRAPWSAARWPGGRVVVWGAGPIGKGWARALAARGPRRARLRRGRPAQARPAHPRRAGGRAWTRRPASRRRAAPRRRRASPDAREAIRARRGRGLRDERPHRRGLRYSIHMLGLLVLALAVSCAAPPAAASAAAHREAGAHPRRSRTGAALGGDELERCCRRRPRRAPARRPGRRPHRRSRRRARPRPAARTTPRSRSGRWPPSRSASSAIARAVDRAARRAAGPGAGGARRGRRRRWGRSATRGPRPRSRSSCSRPLPPRRRVVTVRGDDPGSTPIPGWSRGWACSPWPASRTSARAEPALLVGGRAALRLVGGDLGGDAPGERRACGRSCWPAVASTDPLSRAWPRAAWARSRTRRTLDALLPLLRDRDETVVVNAVRAVALLGEARAVPAVAGAARLRERRRPRGGAAGAGRAAPRPRPARARRGRGGQRPSPGCARPRCWRWRSMDREEFALVLSSLDPDPVVGRCAPALAGALAIAGDEASQAILLAMLKDEDPRVLPGGAGGAAQGARRGRRGHAAPPPRAPGLRGARGRRRGAGRARRLTGPRRGAGRPPRARAAATSRSTRASPWSTPWPRCRRTSGRRATLREVARERSRRASVRARAAAAPCAPEAGGARSRRGARWTARPSTTARRWPPTIPSPDVAALHARARFLHTRHGRIEIHLNVVEAPLTERLLPRPRPPRLLRRAHLPPRGAAAS